MLGRRPKLRDPLTRGRHRVASDQQQVGGTNMRSGLLRSRWAAVGAAVAVTLGGGTVWVASAAAPTAPTSFVATDPTRVLDTREPTSPIKTLGLGGNVTLSLAAVVPAEAVAVSLNV